MGEEYKVKCAFSIQYIYYDNKWKTREDMKQAEP